MAWLRLISVALGQPFLTPVGCFCVASLVSGSPHCSGRAAALVDKTRRDGPRSHLSTMLRTFSGRQPHPAAAEAPQPGSDPAVADAVAPPPLPERSGTPSQDAGSPSTEPPPAGSVAAGEAAWEAQLAALEASKAAKRASLAAPLVGGSHYPGGAAPADDSDANLSGPDSTLAVANDDGSRPDDSSDSDAEDDELTAAIAEARIAARRISLSVDEAPPPPPPTRTRSAPVPHKRRLSHEERATPLSHLRHLLMPNRDRAASSPRTPSPRTLPPPPRASMAAAATGFARRGEKLEGVNRATEGLAEAARQYRENARKREADARKSRSRWF